MKAGVGEYTGTPPRGLESEPAGEDPGWSRAPSNQDTPPPPPPTNPPYRSPPVFQSLLPNSFRTLWPPNQLLLTWLRPFLAPPEGPQRPILPVLRLLVGRVYYASQSRKTS